MRSSASCVHLPGIPNLCEGQMMMNCTGRKHVWPSTALCDYRAASGTLSRGLSYCGVLKCVTTRAGIILKMCSGAEILLTQNLTMTNLQLGPRQVKMRLSSGPPRLKERTHPSLPLCRDGSRGSERPGCSSAVH